MIRTKLIRQKQPDGEIECHVVIHADGVDMDFVCDSEDAANKFMKALNGVAYIEVR